MAEQLHKWQEDFELKDALTQGDIEAVEMALLNMPYIATSNRHADLSIVRGSWFRAAIEAGWILAPECKTMIDDKSREKSHFFNGVEVSKMNPAHVGWYGSQVITKHDSTLYDDPN